MRESVFLDVYLWSDLVVLPPNNNFEDTNAAVVRACALRRPCLCFVSFLL